MATKTWKIGEYCIGGIITVNTTSNSITIIGKDWDFSAGSNRGSNQSKAKEWTRFEISTSHGDCYRECINFLEDLTTLYYAGEIMKWIESKVEIAKNKYFSW